jgi:hypothetical protein
LAAALAKPIKTPQPVAPAILMHGGLMSDGENTNQIVTGQIRITALDFPRAAPVFGQTEIPMGTPLPFPGEFEVVIMIEVAIEEMDGSN